MINNPDDIGSEYGNDNSNNDYDDNIDWDSENILDDGAVEISDS